MFRRPLPLPAVPIYMIKAAFDDEFGGMTSVLLQRSTTFSEIEGSAITILTTSPSHAVDPDGLRHKLVASGRLGERVALRNAWADLRNMTDNELAALSVLPQEPVAVDDDFLPFQGNPETVRTNEAGAVLQIDRFRSDGTRYMIDRRDMKGLGRPGGRMLTALSRDGDVIGQWDGARHVYHAWMDWVTKGTPAVFVPDSAHVGNLLHEYRRDNILLVQPLHSHHLAGDRNNKEHLAPSKTHILINLDNYDRVAVLTEAQREALIQTGIASDNTVTLPNMVGSKPIKRLRHRPRTAGTIIGRLVPSKRVDHAITAVADANKRGNSISLDIYGSGEDYDRLSALIDQLNVDSTVALKGYDPNARQHFEQTSFSVLASMHEGQGLVLIESMAAGCIPIAYDIEYGPSDIITDGVDGFLVSPGDVDALSGAIERAATMSDRALMRMRKAAVRRSRDFSPQAITRLWAETLTTALENKPADRNVKGKARLVEAIPAGDRIHVTIEVTGEAAAHPAWAKVARIGRKNRYYGRSEATIEQQGKKLLVEADLPSWEGGEQVMDVYVDLRVDGTPTRKRVSCRADDILPVHSERSELYVTAYGNVSVRKLPEEQ